MYIRGRHAADGDSCKDERFLRYCEKEVMSHYQVLAMCLRRLLMFCTDTELAAPYSPSYIICDST